MTTVLGIQLLLAAAFGVLEASGRFHIPYSKFRDFDRRPGQQPAGLVRGLPGAAAGVRRPARAGGQPALAVPLGAAGRHGVPLRQTLPRIAVPAQVLEADRRRRLPADHLGLLDHGAGRRLVPDPRRLRGAGLGARAAAAADTPAPPSSWRASDQLLPPPAAGPPAPGGRGRAGLPRPPGRSVPVGRLPPLPGRDHLLGGLRRHVRPAAGLGQRRGGRRSTWARAAGSTLRWYQHNLPGLARARRALVPFLF